jgi:hypothetical protein
MSSKTSKDEESEAGSSKKLQTESLFYKDSSLFLKVGFKLYVDSFDQFNLFILPLRALNRQTRTTITVSILSTRVKDLKTLSETLDSLTVSRNIQNFVNLFV